MESWTAGSIRSLIEKKNLEKRGVPTSKAIKITLEILRFFTSVIVARRFVFEDEVDIFYFLYGCY